MTNQTENEQQVDGEEAATNNKTEKHQIVKLSVSEQDIQAKENVLELDDIEVKLVREILFSKLDLGDFDKKEIERFSSDDHQIRRYSRLGQDRLSTLYRTAACIKASMEWRRSLSLGQLKDVDEQQQFSEEIRQANRNNIYINGSKTLLGENILWFRVAGHKRQYFTEEFKQYLAYQLERVDSISNSSGFIICIDCTNAGTSNIDLEFSNYFTKSVLHFRGNLRYVLVLNMGWLLSAAWKIIKSWLPQEQRDHVKMVNKKELTQIVADDQLPEYAPL